MKRPLIATFPSLLLPLITPSTAQTPKINGYVEIGDTGVSAQQLFLGTEKRVYVVDKTENNPISIGEPSHPAWATNFDLTTNRATAMDIRTNSFCAGGAVTGDGRWVNAGGNQPVTNLGAAATGGTAPYYNLDGGLALRTLKPCDDDSCQWTDDRANYMQSRRWYPTLETLQDGSIILIGGDFWGGFVNGNDQNNPTVEYFPTKGQQVNLTLLVDSMPANLYSLTWLVPSGKLFIQTGWLTALYDWENNVETRLPNVTHAIRVYPASAGQAMLPLRPQDNYEAKVLFCGGMDVADNEWKTHDAEWFRNKPASTSCVSIKPDDPNPTWTDEDDLPEGRVMGNMIILPDQTMFLTNGVGKGVAGYNDSNVPYSNPADAVMTPAIYHPNAAAGKRWQKSGLGSLIYPRVYHSTATLLADGSVLIAGSNPYVDFITEGTAGAETYTQTKAEVFYPWYYSKTRPNPQGLPTALTYGGNYYDVKLSASESTNMDNTYATCIRTGFSTHAQNFGQRMIIFNSTYTRNEDGSATMHLSQAPPNAAIFPPGPCLYFVVSDGVPSQGKMMMLGSGSIGTQPTQAAANLPPSSGKAVTGTVNNPTGGNGGGNNAGNNNSNNDSPANRLKVGIVGLAMVAGLMLLV